MYNMTMKSGAGIVIKQEWEAWMTLGNPDTTLDEAIERLQAKAILDTGKPMNILEIDRENNRIKVLYVEA